MSKNIITESELRNKVASLREYMAVVEGGATNPAAQQQAPAAGQPSAATNLATGVGNALGTAAGVVAAPARAVWDAAKGVWNHAGEIGQGIAQGWNKTDPATMLGLNKPGATQGTKPKWPTTPAEIGAFQKANGLKPDQLIGQKTLAALQKAGYTPPAGFTPVGNKPAQGTKPAPATTPAAPTAPAATGVQAQGDDEGNTIITKPDGTTQLVGPDGKPLANGGRLAPSNATANTTQGPNIGQVNQAGGYDPTIQQTESVGFQDGELSRIVSLVHHR
jgi:hypothetical protein